jgi:hypothetical protein
MKVSIIVNVINCIVSSYEIAIKVVLIRCTLREPQGAY